MKGNLVQSLNKDKRKLNSEGPKLQYHRRVRRESRQGRDLMWRVSPLRVRKKCMWEEGTGWKSEWAEQGNPAHPVWSI